jgi:hypothetical protein
MKTLHSTGFFYAKISVDSQMLQNNTAKGKTIHRNGKNT